MARRPLRSRSIDELAPDPTKAADHDYREDLAGLEALWRERLGLTADTTYVP